MTKIWLQAANPKVSSWLASLLHLLRYSWSRPIIDFHPLNPCPMCLPDHHEPYESGLSRVPLLYKY